MIERYFFNRYSVRDFFDAFLITLIVAFLLTYFNPQLLFLKTITCGGDTGSHYYSALYLKDVLLPQGKVIGWLRANYAGFPIFYHYFPLPFVVMAIIGYIIPLEISFKLITVISVLLLPIGVYFMFRFMEYEYPIPVSGAIISLAFLFNEKNSMWGGNIASMLAGEFSFSLSLAIFVLFIGTFYKGIVENKKIVLNAVLFALMALSHGYTLVIFMGASIFFLLKKDVLKNLWYLLKVCALGTVFMSFWFFPFLANLPWVTPFRIKWGFTSMWEIFPPILIPFFALSLLGLVLNYRDRRSWFFVFVTSIAIAGYFLAYNIGLADIRFLTFAQLFLTIMAAISFQAIIGRVRVSIFALFALIFGMYLWIGYNTSYIKDWIKWNYSGFESKDKWHEVKEIFEYLRQDSSGRVVYENSTLYDRFGTMRIFESLRMFAGRDTLEGLYMQSSITSPFVFFIQSEISKEVSAPLWDYPVSSFNLETGAKHLSMFNVTQFIVISDLVKEGIKNRPEFAIEKRFGDIEIYRLTITKPNYVIPVEYEPVAYTKDTWKKDFYNWFKKPETLDVPLVYVGKDAEASRAFKLKADSIENLPKAPLSLPKYTLKEKIGNEFIEFETSLINHPHIIRVSYHPNWRVEGAKKVYLVAPSFMLVYPEQNKVRLVFSKSIYNYIGEGLTIIAILGTIVYSLRKSKFKKHEKSIKSFF